MKLEFDLPEFEKSLNISIIIRKDGEVIYTSSSLSGDLSASTKPLENQPETKIGEDTSPAQVKEETKKAQAKSPAKKKISGNLMDMEF